MDCQSQQATKTPVKGRCNDVAQVVRSVWQNLSGT